MILTSDNRGCFDPNGTVTVRTPVLNRMMITGCNIRFSDTLEFSGTIPVHNTGHLAENCRFALCLDTFRDIPSAAL